MGLFNFPSTGEWMIPSFLVLNNTAVSAAKFKHLIKSVVLKAVGAASNNGDIGNEPSRSVPPFSSSSAIDEDDNDPLSSSMTVTLDLTATNQRRVSITHFKSLCRSGTLDKAEGESITTGSECCSVCLCKFEEEEEVSQLVSCKHFFHMICLDKWFQNQQLSTCPLCRSTS